jgi:hypothetical protein
MLRVRGGIIARFIRPCLFLDGSYGGVSCREVGLAGRTGGPPRPTYNITWSPVDDQREAARGRVLPADEAQRLADFVEMPPAGVICLKLGVMVRDRVVF